MTIEHVIAVTIALVASASDLRFRRIPNALTFGGAIAALVFAAFTHGISGVGSSLIAWLMATAVWLPIYALGGMGAGDVKLMAAVGAWLGPGDVAYAALYAAIAGAGFALGLAIIHGCVRQTISNVQLLINHWQVVGFAPHAQLTLGTATSPRLAYAVPVLTGTVMTIWLR
jgi:prepilin peptidase CpaA